MTSNYTFPCASVNGLTLTQKREAVKYLRMAIREEAIIRKMVKETQKAEKIAAREAKKAAADAKKADRIAKLEAKLLALKTPKVGTAAVKANRRPSKAVVTRVAA